jgi:multiple sugar transport system substrate-binding protein
MTNPSAGVYGTEMDPSDSFDPWKIWWTFAMQEGQNFVSPNLQTAEVNTPDVVNSVQFWFDWATKYHIVDPNSMSWQTSNAQQAFENGKVGMLVEVTPTVNPELESSSVKGDYAFAPMPSIPYGMTQRPAGGVPDETSVSGDMLSVASYSNEKTLAFKFINFLTSTPQQLQWTKTFGDLPANVQAANQLESSDPQIKAFLQAEQSATPVPMTGAWGSLEVALGGVSSKIANQIATNSYNPSNVQSLMNQANTTIQGQLKQQQQ